MADEMHELADLFAQELFYERDDEHVFRWSDTRIVAENDPWLSDLPQRLAELVTQRRAES